MSLIKTSHVTESRMERAVRIFDAGLVRRISAGTFAVKSESRNLRLCPKFTQKQFCPKSDRLAQKVEELPKSGSISGRGCELELTTSNDCKITVAGIGIPNGA